MSKRLFDTIRRLLGRPLTQGDVDAINASMKPDAPSEPERNTTPGKIGAEGIALIKRFEGLRLSAYLCPAKVLTIGYGSTGPHVRPGMKIDEPEAERLLRDDLARFERCVAVKCPTALPRQFDAMVSLAFNIGCAGFEKSTVARMHNAGKFAAAADAFAMWNKGGGKVQPGLVKRRAAERALYERGSA